MDDILVFGHSVTAGYWDPEGGWVQRLKTFLDRRALESGAEENVYYLYNLGVSGDTTADLLERMEDEFRRRTEEEYETLLLIQIGANDAIYLKEEGEYRIAESDFRDNLEEILDLAQALAEKVVLVGDFIHDPEIREIPYAPELVIDHEKFEEYEAIKQEMCEEKGIDYIDLLSAASDREENELLEEGVHPNAEGHELIFQQVKKELEQKNLL